MIMMVLDEQEEKDLLVVGCKKSMHRCRRPALLVVVRRVCM